MRRILTCLAATALSFAVVGPALASPDVTNFQVRTYGAESWLTNMSDESPAGIYYDAYVQAFVAEDTRPGMSLDWVYFGYRTWEKLASGDWELRADVSGYAPEGAAGLSMSVGDLTWATVEASVPVGWCRSYEIEDEGGGCTDYVTTGTVDLDLSWTPTTGILSWQDTNRYGDPGWYLANNRRTSHYRDASLSGQVTFPEWGTLDVASLDGSLTRYGIGEHEVIGPRQ